MTMTLERRLRAPYTDANVVKGKDVVLIAVRLRQTARAWELALGAQR